MKKLMLALAVATLGIAANAASASWLISGISPYPTSATITEAQIYGFDTSVVSQQAALTAILAGGDSLTALLAKGYVSEGYDSGDAYITVSGYANGAAVDQYFLVFNNAVLEKSDYVFVSEVDGEGRSIATSGASPAEATASVAAYASDTFNTSTFSAGGWYAIPEPTSGLLLLVGGALLALKRRRA